VAGTDTSLSRHGGALREWGPAFVSAIIGAASDDQSRWRKERMAMPSVIALNTSRMATSTMIGTT
jgi:hypothetical protein